MKTVHVHLGERGYDILIAPGLLEKAGDLFLKNRVGKRIFVVANDDVFQLYGQSLLEQLRERFEATEILIPDGEKHKNLVTVENIYTYLIAQGADRDATLVALGGGVTGDIVGFAAATFLRGIRYIQVPTTLVSQVDSSVGGKTGVNYHLAKNMIGAFYQPHLVYIDPNTLSSLPEREFQSGLYEVVKYGLIYDAEFLSYLDCHLEAIKQRDPAILEQVIGRCCEIKAEITSLDERESDLRRILNFGHTFAHALEAVNAFQGITHGEAVGYGMVAATRLSRSKGLLKPEQAEHIEGVVRKIGPLPSIEDVSAERMLESMERDKKRKEGQIMVVLLKEIGRTLIQPGGEAEISEIWEELRSAC
ncbi:MAG: 3-dehydroquinate synthase [Acidobacteria bacterium]|nr:3-dehydroquinate synthase [Acidobacteriota bacterium]